METHLLYTVVFEEKNQRRTLAVREINEFLALLAYLKDHPYAEFISLTRHNPESPASQTLF